MRAAVLTFHSVRRGGTYHENDHVALGEVLRELSAHRIPVRPLRDIVAALSNPFRRWRLPARVVALTCDDGERGEVDAMPADDGATMPSFLSLQQACEKAQAEFGGIPHMTSFVIASAEARAQILPNGDLGDGWWRQVAGSRLGEIENHSWDHCHPSVATIAQHAQEKGTFRGVDNFADADRQVREAARSIDAVIGPNRTRLFAYPFGDYNDFLVREYFPQRRCEHRMEAAFTTDPAPVTPRSNRWALPRYVCGHHWKSPGEFRALLKDAGVGG